MASPAKPCRRFSSSRRRAAVSNCSDSGRGEHLLAHGFDLLQHFELAGRLGGSVRLLARAALGHGVVVRLPAGGVHVEDGALDGGGRDAVLGVVRHLNGAPAIRLTDGVLHRVGLAIRVHHDLATGIARRATDGLNQRARAAQKALFVGVQDGDQLTSGRSKPSRSRLMPTNTSNSPARKSRRISMRSIVSMSVCR